MRLEHAVRAAVERGGRRPGLLVVGATHLNDAAVASAGSLPLPECPPERVLFEIGSVTKVYTALLLAIAVERGEASLDDPLATHLPEGSRVPRHPEGEITLLHLATHASGLPRLPPGLLWDALRHRDDPYARLSRDDVLHALEITTLRRAPGRRFKYSNFGAGVLGLALAYTAGVDYEILVRDRITGPLAMNDTVITLTPEQRSRLAPGTRRGGKPAGLWSIPGLAGAGALRSTVADQFTFLRAQMGILPADTPAELAAAIPSAHTPRSRGSRLAPAVRMGLGWILLPIGRQRLNTVWHNGGTGGYRSFVGWAPSVNVGAVALSSNTRSVDRFGSRVLLDLSEKSAS